MKSFVIAIENHTPSQQVADRCIDSGKKYGIHVEKWKATTPDDFPIDKLLKETIYLS